MKPTSLSNLSKGELGSVNGENQIHQVSGSSRSSVMASTMEMDIGENGHDDLQMINRLNESRSPYVSPRCVALRPTRKRLELKGLLLRFEDT